jgi:hypothetical protein
MIYDPARRALDLRQRVLERMTAEELEEYARRHPPSEPDQPITEETSSEPSKDSDTTS